MSSDFFPYKGGAIMSTHDFDKHLQRRCAEVTVWLGLQIREEVVLEGPIWHGISEDRSWKLKREGRLLHHLRMSERLLASEADIARLLSEHRWEQRSIEEKYLRLTKDRGLEPFLADPESELPLI
jgi:hypothetical protein